MVLTIKQAEQFKNGKLTRSNFFKLINTYEFEDYLFRYCKIVSDKREEYLNSFYRNTTFLVFEREINLELINGKFNKLTY